MDTEHGTCRLFHVSRMFHVHVMSMSMYHGCSMYGFKAVRGKAGAHTGGGGTRAESFGPIGGGEEGT